MNKEICPRHLNLVGATLSNLLCPICGLCWPTLAPCLSQYSPAVHLAPSETTDVYGFIRWSPFFEVRIVQTLKEHFLFGNQGVNTCFPLLEHEIGFYMVFICSSFDLFECDSIFKLGPYNQYPQLQLASVRSAKSSKARCISRTFCDTLATSCTYLTPPCAKIFKKHLGMSLTTSCTTNHMNHVF